MGRTQRYFVDKQSTSVTNWDRLQTCARDQGRMSTGCLVLSHIILLYFLLFLVNKLFPQIQGPHIQANIGTEKSRKEKQTVLLYTTHIILAVQLPSHPFLIEKADST